MQTASTLSATLAAAGFRVPAHSALAAAADWLAAHNIDERPVYASVSIENATQLNPISDEAASVVGPYSWAMTGRRIPAWVFDRFGRAQDVAVAA